MPEFSEAFALLPGDKRPVVKWTDPTQCHPPAYFGDQRYGLPCGPRNGIWVLDLDNKSEVSGMRSLVMYASERGAHLPDTYTVRSPSGGCHLYFLWPPNHHVGNSVGILPGVDVRGDRGYVCA